MTRPLPPFEKLVFINCPFDCPLVGREDGELFRNIGDT